ncbi:MAG: LemA family protein [Bacteroidota bacterium]|nr:LemA family protein [Bacteroidota bacterium]
MKKWLVPVGIIVVLLIMMFSSYNGLVSLQADAQQSWADVQSSYQRRMDLIENLVETVKGAAQNEKDILVGVTEARSKATATNINVDDIASVTPEQMADFQKAQAGMSSALSRLLVSVERYPDIKSNQNFLELQSQIEGTENRINVARDRFNASATIYNKKVKSMPTVLYAGLLGFEKMTLFEADKEAQKAPKVKF